MPIILSVDPYKSLSEVRAIAHNVLAGRFLDGHDVPESERVRLRQQDVAARLGVSQPTLSDALAYDYEGGSLSMWRVGLLLRVIAEVGGLDVGTTSTPDALDVEPRWRVTKRRPPRHAERGDVPRGDVPRGDVPRGDVPRGEQAEEEEEERQHGANR